MAAHDLFLRAEAKQETLDPASLQESIMLYKDALALDPNYVDALNGLGYSYMWQTSPLILGGVPATRYPLMEEVARRALYIEANNARAMGLLGLTVAVNRFEWHNGIALMDDALKLNPGDAEIMASYSYLLMMTSRKGWTEVADRAYQLNPLSSFTISLKMAQLQTGGQYPEAMKLIEKVLSGNADHFYLNMLRVMHAFDPYPPTHALYNPDVYRSVLKEVKAVVGTDHPWLRLYELMFAARENDSDLFNSIFDELASRSRHEPVALFAPLGFSTAQQVAVMEILSEQRQLSLVLVLLGAKPDGVAAEVWASIRERYNIAELENDDLLN
jgi:tetratricopeptide (TPR) repeat protein